MTKKSSWSGFLSRKNDDEPDQPEDLTELSGGGATSFPDDFTDNESSDDEVSPSCKEPNCTLEPWDEETPETFPIPDDEIEKKKDLFSKELSREFGEPMEPDEEPEPEPELLTMEFSGDINVLTKYLIDEVKRFVGKKKVVLGLSGGLDSAVVAALCRQALGFERTICVYMPYGGVDKDTSLVSRLATKMMLQRFFVDIRPAVDATVASIKSIFPNAEMSKVMIGNVMARERMKVLYAVANMNDALVVGTGNKTEIYLGYSTKHGDAAADFFPIGDCLKCDVRALASHLGILQEVIDRPPSAELWEGQTDEGELGMTYNQLDALVATHIHCHITDDLLPENPQVLKDYGIDPIAAVDIFGRIVCNEHKRSMAPVFSVTHLTEG